MVKCDEFFTASITSVNVCSEGIRLSQVSFSHVIMMHIDL